MKKTVLFLLAVVMIFSSCKEDPATTGTLEIVFKAEYGGNPLVMYENNATSLTDPTQIQFTKLEVFIADLKANKGSSLMELKEVGHVSLTSTTTAATAAQGTTITINDLAAGSYSNLQIGVGLPNAINETSPGDYSSDSPLGVNANYWANWDSYILSKIEGNITKSDNSTAGYVYHSGVNGMYQTRTFANNFDITAGGTTQIVITLDAAKLFFDSNSMIDLVNNPMTHSGSTGSASYNLAEQSISNIATSMSIE